jgi:hypothetical protein
MFTSACFSSEKVENGNTNTIFTHDKSNGTNYYSKHESSGCTTEIMLRPIENSLALNLSYGIGCMADKNELESVQDIAGSLVEIIKENSLGEAIKKRKVLAVKYSWKIAHWPLIESINNDTSWPVDIFKDLLQRYPGEKIRYSAYIKMLRSKILEQDVYSSFIDAMHKIGCSANLEEYYADPIFMSKKFVTKQKDLVDFGIYKPEQVKKHYYPFLKSPITFNIDCQEIKLDTLQ